MNGQTMRCIQLSVQTWKGFQSAWDTSGSGGESQILNLIPRLVRAACVSRERQI
ncbi:uncharacterized protein ARMOST_13565 [Armillaria ostoyae]|uniref:Uncharacterized protein n=1 Tax=Armillaria ostoyae TaxID=47428 RepID=A0A284RN77_ARMOS|nr:uncharacterized protein ARMOST_13565 [Armillaria ostoyae]